MAFGQLRALISPVKSNSYAGSSSRIPPDPTGERRNWQFRQRFRSLRSCRPNPSGESGFRSAHPGLAPLTEVAVVDNHNSSANREGDYELGQGISILSDFATIGIDLFFGRAGSTASRRIASAVPGKIHLRPLRREDISAWK